MKIGKALTGTILLLAKKQIQNLTNSEITNLSNENAMVMPYFGISAIFVWVGADSNYSAPPRRFRK